MQEMLGLPQQRKTDCSTVISLLRIYAKAREQEILCYAIHGEEPPLPDTALNALLLMLIDRCIVFERTDNAIRTSRDPRPFDERLEDRCIAMRRGIEDVTENVRREGSRFFESLSTGKTEDGVDKEAEPKLWTQFVPMIPSVELDLAYPKPWFAEEWLSKHLPKECWPKTVTGVMVRKEDAAPRDQQLATVDKPEPVTASGPAQQAQSATGSGENVSNKRKREEEDGEDGCPENRSKAQVAEVKVETSYFTMGDLVFRPKK